MLNKKVDPENFTSTDLRGYWIKKYSLKYNEQYNTHGYIGRELSFLKKLLSEYDVYEILLAMNRAINDGEKALEYFCSNIRQYFLTSLDPRIEFFVAEHGSEIEKKKFQEAILLDSVWFPLPLDVQKKKALIRELNNWIDEKEKKVDYNVGQ